MNDEHVKWHSVANPSTEQLGGEIEKSSGKRHYIPDKDKLRQWAQESAEGGRATCAKCGHTFAMYYIRKVKISSFKTDFACVDCKKKYNLQVVK